MQDPRHSWNRGLPLETKPVFLASFGTHTVELGTLTRKQAKALQLTFGDQIKLFSAKNNKNRRLRKSVLFLL